MLTSVRWYELQRPAMRLFWARGAERAILKRHDAIEPLLHGADVNLPPALLAQIAAIKVFCDYIVDSEAVNDPRQRAHVVLQFREQGAVVAGITHRALLRVVCGHLVDCVNFRPSGHR
jgi:hypothetical protein